MDWVSTHIAGPIHDDPLVYNLCHFRLLGGFHVCFTAQERISSNLDRPNDWWRPLKQPCTTQIQTLIKIIKGKDLLTCGYELNSTINSLNLIFKPNELNLSWKLSSLTKWTELKLYNSNRLIDELYIHIWVKIW